jgi:hypothetical protein
MSKRKKYSPSIDLGHIGELHAIDRAFQERGESEGIRPHIVELIARLTDGLWKSDAAVYAAQTKRWWDLGWGKELGVRTLKQYRAKVPGIPASLFGENEEFPLLTLLDPRPGLVPNCCMAGIRHGEWYQEGDAVPCDGRHADPTEPIWIRAHNGWDNWNHRPSECLADSTGNLFAGTAKVLAALWGQHESVREVCAQEGRIMDGPGSVHRDNREECACLRVSGGRPELHLSRCDDGDPDCGSVAFHRE